MHNMQYMYIYAHKVLLISLLSKNFQPMNLNASTEICDFTPECIFRNFLIMNYLHAKWESEGCAMKLGTNESLKNDSIIREQKFKYCISESYSGRQFLSVSSECTNYLIWKLKIY